MENLGVHFFSFKKVEFKFLILQVDFQLSMYNVSQKTAVDKDHCECNFLIYRFEHLRFILSDIRSKKANSIEL